VLSRRIQISDEVYGTKCLASQVLVIPSFAISVVLIIDRNRGCRKQVPLLSSLIHGFLLRGMMLTLRFLVVTAYTILDEPIERSTIPLPLVKTAVYITESKLALGKKGKCGLFTLSHGCGDPRTMSASLYASVVCIESFH
jgi:hypothetical protein